MKSDKLRKVLLEMETRLGRIAKRLDGIDAASDTAVDLTRHIGRLRAYVRRLESKAELLRADDVDDLQSEFSWIRSMASQQALRTPKNSPYFDALTSLQDDEVLANLAVGLRIGLSQIGPEEVLDAVPGQKLAAFQFEIVGDELRVVDQPFRPNQREKEMALAAIEAAIDQGDGINEDLATTNASPRLREAFIQLQETLKTHKNIVQIGSRARVCSRLVAANTEELSNSLFALLESHIETVFSALAQFEDWRIYCENAAAVGLDKDSVDELVQSARVLIEKLKIETSVNPEVTDALDAVATWASEGSVPDKRDVLTLARTLGNLWSLISKTILSVGAEVAKIGRIQVAGLILGALISGASLSVPHLSKIPGGEWVQLVYNYFKASKPSIFDE